MEQILEINRLTKTFKKQTVVDEVSFGVTKNSVYGLLGPNGAGKSTTLKMITGMLQPSSGSISFEGACMEQGGSEEHRCADRDAAALR